MNFNFFFFSTNNEIDGRNAKLESLRISIETNWNTLKESKSLGFVLPITIYSFSLG